jgi:hypothetical protein
VIGTAGTGNGMVTLAQIRHNYIHNTGDDGIWIEGWIWPTNKICYNLLQNVGDNGIDCMNSANLEIYNNTFNGGENESLVIWGSASGNDASAFVYNNIFRNWGSDWITGAAGRRRGVAIGINLYESDGTVRDEVGESLIDNNIFYSEDDTTATDHPFEVGEATKTFTEWQAYGLDANSTIDDPELTDPDNDLLKITRASPCFETGLDLSALDAEMTFATVPIYFDKSGAITNALDYLAAFPADVRLSAQDTLWDMGAYDEPGATIVDDAATFPTDKSLIGVTAYVTDATNHRIWKGIITDNIGTELYLDEWEPVFNASGYYPGGDLTYYVGYIYLYDKTPVLAFENTQWEKGLTEHELLTNNIGTSNPIFFKRSINHGTETATEANALSGDRMTRRVLAGLHRNFQHEHALLTNQAIRVKSAIYHVVWKRGKFDQ